MPSLRAGTWEQGRCRLGCAVPGVPRSFCRQGQGGDAPGATASVRACGRGAAPGVQHTPFTPPHTPFSLPHTPFLAAHTFPFLSQPVRAGLFQVSGHGQGKSGAQPPPWPPLSPSAPRSSPGLGRASSPPWKSRLLQPLQPREAMEFDACSPAHPMDLIRPLAAGAAQVSAALPALVQSALVTRESASFPSKPTRPELVQGCEPSKALVEAHTSFTQCCGKWQRATDPRNCPRHRPRYGEKDLTVPDVPGHRTPARRRLGT